MSRYSYTLFVLPPVPICYNTSPFSIKLESYFRVNQIKYDIVYTTKTGSAKVGKGTIPYIRILDAETGEEREVVDTHNVIQLLKKNHASTDEKAMPTGSERAIAHTTTRMIEEHTTRIGFYFRYGLRMEEMITNLDLLKRFFNTEPNTMKGFMIKHLPVKMMSSKIIQRAKVRGFLRHEEEDLWRFSNDDLKALSELLGSKKYFFGDTASTLDCTVFGHVSQFFYVPIDSPQKKFIKTECPNLAEFCDRFRAEFWPDWEEKCKPQQNAWQTSSSGARPGGYVIVAGVVGVLAVVLGSKLLHR